MIIASTAHVQLTQVEMLAAAQTGVMRQIASLSQNLQNNSKLKKTKENNWQWHVEGALAELALCKLLGTYWGYHVNNFKGADVGSRIDVKVTQHSKGSLLIRPWDKEERIYVLAVGKNGTYVFKGWLYGSEGKHPTRLTKLGNEGVEVYAIPGHELRPMSELMLGGEKTHG